MTSLETKKVFCTAAVYRKTEGPGQHSTAGQQLVTVKASERVVWSYFREEKDSAPVATAY